jgi:ribonuclease HI
MSGDLFSDMTPAAATAGSVATPAASAEAAGGWFTAHCDGGSRGNPGPAAYGAVIENPQGTVVARLSRFLGKQTNNYAEYSGLLAVLDWALESGARRLRVISDSELMVRQMTGRYKVASPGLRPLWEQARRRAARLDGFEIRHTLRGGNREADRLANEAMDEGGKQAAPAKR